MKPFLFFFLLLPCTLVLAGCGSSEEATQDETGTEGQEVQQAPPPAPTQPASVETKTDTIATVHQQAQEPEPPQKTVSPVTGKFRVQVGAFRKAAHATALENLVKGRFSLPTTSEYSQARGVYRVRVGEFSAFSEANAFRTKIRKDYPAEFGDAWIVDTEREHE